MWTQMPTVKGSKLTTFLSNESEKINHTDQFLRSPSRDTTGYKNNSSHPGHLDTGHSCTPSTSIYSHLYCSEIMKLQAKIQRSLSLDTHFAWEALRIREIKCPEHTEFTREWEREREREAGSFPPWSLLFLPHYPGRREAARASSHMEADWEARHLSYKMKQ